MSTRFDNIIGNGSLRHRMAQDIDLGTLAHAYIVEGPAGSGRRTLTLSVICAIACENRGKSCDTPCGKCKSCKKILEKNSPDVIFVGLESDRVTIGVDTVRAIKEDVYTEPNDLSIKAYIIEDADTMTEQAQNAFLLLLESPPPYAVFFLICKNSTSLLETVRSRAPTLRLERLPLDDVKSYLLKNEKRAATLYEENPHELELAVFCGEGSIGASLALLDGRRRASLMESRETVRRMISLLGGRNKAAAFEMITLFGNKRAEIARRLSQLQIALRDLIMLKKSDSTPLCFFEDRDEAAELSTSFSSTSLFALYDAAGEAISALEANANVRLTLIGMMQRASII